MCQSFFWGGTPILRRRAGRPGRAPSHHLHRFRPPPFFRVLSRFAGERPKLFGGIQLCPKFEYFRVFCDEAHVSECRSSLTLGVRIRCLRGETKRNQSPFWGTAPSIGLLSGKHDKNQHGRIVFLKLVPCRVGSKRFAKGESQSEIHLGPKNRLSDTYPNPSGKYIFHKLLGIFRDLYQGAARFVTSVSSLLCNRCAWGRHTAGRHSAQDLSTCSRCA